MPFDRAAFLAQAARQTARDLGATIAERDRVYAQLIEARGGER